MYRIRLPDGEERLFATIQELADAVRRGAVDEASQIFHRRTGRWLPLSSHPYFDREQAGKADEDVELIEQPDMDFDDMEPLEPLELEPAESGAARGEPPARPAVPPPPVPDAPADAEAPPTSASPPPLPPPPPRASVAPTPLHVPPPRPVDPRVPREERSAPPPESPREDVAFRAPGAEQPFRPPRRRGGLFLIVVIVVLAAAGAAGFFRWRALQPLQEGVEAAGTSQPAYRPAPPPSELLGADEPAADSAAAPSPVRRDRPLPDPTRPMSVDALMARRDAAFETIRSVFARDFIATGAPGIFSPPSTASPEAARRARRTVASALNVIAAFHRREVMTDQAYADTARFQRQRAGWPRADIDRWNANSSARASFQSSDLAQSLLADADSLLAILAGRTDWTLAGDTVLFDDAAVGAAYRAQRERIAARRQARVADSARAVTLTAVRSAVDPAPLPVTP